MRDSSLFPWIGRFSFERTPTKHVVHLLLYHPPSSSSCAVFHYTSKRSHREKKKWNSSYCPLASDYGYSGRHSRFIATIYNNVFFEGYAERNWHGELKELATVKRGLNLRDLRVDIHWLQGMNLIWFGLIFVINWCGYINHINVQTILDNFLLKLDWFRLYNEINCSFCFICFFSVLCK